MPGISRNRPNMGTRRKKFIATGKKPLKYKTILLYDWFLFIQKGKSKIDPNKY